MFGRGTIESVPDELLRVDFVAKTNNDPPKPRTVILKRCGTAPLPMASDIRKVQNYEVVQ